MKLELKHIAPYLPYGLKADFRLKETSELPLENYQHDGIIEVDAFLVAYLDTEVEYFKPILRPLSDYKKIPEIMEEFSEHSQELFETAFIVFGCLSRFDKVNYTIMELMFKHHIDIFNLIPKGLAIDVNTI